jgi:hypothetical protein
LLGPHEHRDALEFLLLPLRGRVSALRDYE